MKTEPMTMASFFSLPEVKALQAIQQKHPFGSPEHRKAFEDLKALAESKGIDAEKFFGDYE